MTNARLATLFGAAAMIGGFIATTDLANAACPGSAGSSAPMVMAQDRNGAGQPVDRAGIPIPGTSLGAAADDRDWQKKGSSAQGAADDREPMTPLQRAQGAAADRPDAPKAGAQVAQGPGTAACN